jgi:hypothetical protein
MKTDMWRVEMQSSVPDCNDLTARVNAAELSQLQYVGTQISAAFPFIFIHSLPCMVQPITQITTSTKKMKTFYDIWRYSVNEN